MGDVVNLNRVKKARTRHAAGVQAAANRVKHGRTAAERLNDQRAEARRRALLDGVAQGPETPHETPPETTPGTEPGPKDHRA